MIVKCTTHGFDTKGSQYEKNGDRGRLWASDADEQEYNRLTKALADYYSTLQNMPLGEQLAKEDLI